ncbi:MAG: hypothetical protein NT062_17980 [Proteobacteria bacterium]|nr:hypothetical protein [Pseudomonadota bacterium]
MMKPIEPSLRTARNHWVHVQLSRSDTWLAKASLGSADFEKRRTQLLLMTPASWCLELPIDLANCGICMTVLATQLPELLCHEAWANLLTLRYNEAAEEACAGHTEPLAAIRRILKRGGDEGAALLALLALIDGALRPDMVRRLDRAGGGFRGGRKSELTFESVDRLLAAREMDRQAIDGSVLDQGGQRRHQPRESDLARKDAVVRELYGDTATNVPRKLDQLGQDARDVLKSSATFRVVVVACTQHGAIHSVEDPNRIWSDFPTADAREIASSRTVTFRYHGPMVAWESLGIPVPHGWLSIRPS